jgi:hypothetical protein
MAENNPDDFYSDAEPALAAAVQEPQPESETEPEKEESAGEQTALLPKAIFMGKELEPGSRCQVEIVREHDGEVEVKYVPHQSGKARSEMDELMA